MDIKKIISGCKQNDRQAQSHLYEHLKVTTMNICMRYASNQYEADDMFQEAFMTIFKRIGSFDENRKDANFGGWAFRLTANVALKHLKAKSGMNFDDVDNIPFQESLTVQSEDNLSSQELQGFIQQLPDAQRIVFNMFAIEGYAHDEIAEQLNITPSTSRGHLFKARARLQAIHVSHFGKHA